MLLLADGGSTKIDWAYIDKENNVLRFQSMGLNPYYLTEEILENEIQNKILPNIPSKIINELYFYGTGCSNYQKKKFMYDAFSKFLPNTNIYIEHDLLGAARAACGYKGGIAAILGTGSSSCLYDGKEIKENIPALGYILCDEGAGTNIGKIVLREYLRNQFPKDLHSEFYNEYPFEENVFLNNLYQGTFPNRYLASFAKFVITRQSNPYCYEIIKEAFENFFNLQITKYTDYKKQTINVVGSVGFYAQQVFKDVAKKYDVTVNKIIKSPIEELIKYHQVGYSN